MKPCATTITTATTTAITTKTTKTTKLLNTGEDSAHVCIGSVFYCYICGLLNIPFMLLGADFEARPCSARNVVRYVYSEPEMDCWPCHVKMCGRWLNKLFIHR